MSHYLMEQLMIVPDGFEVQTDDDGNTALVKDNLAIIVLASDAKSPEDAKKNS